LDAAVLIAGEEPSYFRENHVNALASFLAQVTTVETAIRRAILKNNLAADIVYEAHGYLQPEHVSETLEVTQSWRAFLTLIVDEKVPVFTANGMLDLDKLYSIYMHPEPDWERTLVRRDDLIDWLRERGIFPAFFFPSQPQGGVKDKEHPRYAEKLACAVAAWDAIETPAPNKSVKQTIAAWVRANASEFGLVDEEGRPVETAVEEISKVANWRTKGGANPTSVVATPSDYFNQVKFPVQNFQRAVLPDDLSDVPF
jgi:hypothetical protein